MRALVLVPFTISLLGCDIHRQLGDDLRVEPVAPLAGAGTGSVSAAAAGRPTLRWSSSSQAQTYHLQVDDSCTAAATCDFPSPEIDEAALTTTFYVPPSALPGSSTAPFSRRYFWHVQACKGDSCGEWSATRIFVVGQERTLNRDINGDGYPDFLVGAPYSDAVVLRGGQASVFFGGTALPSRPALVLTGNVESDRLGFGVAMAGDVNGDGYGDYLVRAPGNRGYPVGAGGMQVGTQVGRIMVFFGGPKLKSQPDVVFPAEIPGTLNDFTNGTMVGCGDLNGDGYDDIAFGATDYPNGSPPTTPNRVEIHFGGPDMAASAPLVLYGEDPALDVNGNVNLDAFGLAISAAGDVNGDGYPDLIVGALFSSDTSIIGGKTRIYFGGPQMDSTPDVVLELDKASNPDLACDFFGASVAGLGDVNGDGFADVAVGAPCSDINNRDVINDRDVPTSSRVFVYFGGSTPHAVPDLVLQGDPRTNEFGASVVPAGDVDHDGYADFAVLAPGIGSVTILGQVNAIPLWPGKVYLYSGGQNAGQFLLASLSSVTKFPLFGSLAVLDIDGDAEPEILAGEWAEWDPNATSSSQVGQVAIYRKSDGYAMPARTIPGAPSNYSGVCDANLSP
jgi:hypothetical protein